MRLIALIATLCGLACGSSPPVEQDPTTAESTDAPAEAETTREITFLPSEASLDTDAGMMKLCLNCDVRSATYDYCYFLESEFRQRFPEELQDAELTVTVAMSPIGSETVVPDDPNAPQPDGGFTHNENRCRVLSVQGAGE